MKRSANSSVSDDEGEKRPCISLDISGTCSKLGEMGLSGSSGDCSNLRNSSNTDSSVNLSFILEETRENGLSEVLIEDANNLLREIEEDIPELMSGTESDVDGIGDFAAEDPSSDSGNSEFRWGFTNVNRVLAEGGLRNVSGKLVPVTLGNSSLSDTDDKIGRIVFQMRSITQSSSSDSGNEVQISSNSSDESPRVLRHDPESSVAIRLEGGQVSRMHCNFYVDDNGVHQQVSSEFVEFGQYPEQEAEEYLTCDEWSSDSESNSRNTDATRLVRKML